MSPRNNSKNSKQSFLVGAAARRELRTVLRQTTNPGATIAAFQQSHSLHTMLAKAFHTTPRIDTINTSSRSSSLSGSSGLTESLDTDSVLIFLNHLGVTQHQVHKRITTMLTTQLEDEIRKSTGEPLLKLLKSCWPYSTTIPELRPVLHACLKQLGNDTPLPVLMRLAERDGSGDGQEMKHVEIWHPLPPLLKRLVWEADWDHITTNTTTANTTASESSSTKLGENDPHYKTLFAQQVLPWITLYCQEPALLEAATMTHVASIRERRLLTTQRRAGSTPSFEQAAKAVAELKQLLSNGDTPAYRPKLLYAIIAILKNSTHPLHGTLLADLLLSGPLPKAYQPVLALARILDETVKEGLLSDAHIAQLQQALRQIIPMEESCQSSDVQENTATTDTEASVSKRILPNIIQEAIFAMRESDPQSLFLNPVTDAIAPGYSKVISRPMCMKQMEATKYTTLQEFDADVKLMFQNCINYNVGNAGQWFRGEARRQHSVFNKDIFPPAKKYFESQLQKVKAPELVKRSVGDAEMSPLPKVPAKKQKLDPTMPSMQALATMLLADPFVVRLILDRLLRSLRIDIFKGSTIPVAHRAVPSLFQLLQLSLTPRSRTAVMVPDAGFEWDPADPSPYQALRQYAPLVLKLCLEAELDKRMASDWAAAAASLPPRQPLDWTLDTPSPAVTLVLQGALVHICQPGNTYESSLAVTFPKFVAVLSHCHDRPFFLCLVSAVVRHKKLSKTNRDAIVHGWMGPWITTPAGHECLILLLNEWAGMGNMILSRDVLVQYSKEAAKTASSDLGRLWKQPDFCPIREQYEKLLKGLPESYAMEWRQDMGVVNDVEGEDTGSHDQSHEMEVTKDDQSSEEEEEGMEVEETK